MSKNNTTQKQSVLSDTDSESESEHPQETFKINKPNHVNDILNRTNNIKPTTIKYTNTETQDETTTSPNNDRIISETTYSDSVGNKKRGRKSNKSNISII